MNFKGRDILSTEDLNRDDDTEDIVFHLVNMRTLSALQTFLRGDTNTNAALDIADAIFTLSYLFAEGPAPTCLDASDANDDGAVDIADAIAVLSHLFATAGDLPAPFGECGVDPTVDDLECARYEPCEV